jgi:hypothetical protein
VSTVSEEADDRSEVVSPRNLEDVDDDRTHEMDRDVLPTGELPH